ncbi:MAG: glutamate racemase [Alphaproteobacteria bacterium]|nr:glutamate racemase [Alphaproteobacteria bacterium]MBV8548517.1 glutamate racemase [Alphaproteobacteria bacterium]
MTPVHFEDGRAPIGVFDSGMGGLTVLAALQNALPHEDFIYLGDTARLPYGTKSATAVQQYTLEAARFMERQGVKLMVIACNTATAQALHSTRAALPDIPCLGVIEPGAQAATHHLPDPMGNDVICVWATEGTARSGIYESAIHARRPNARVVMQPCNLLVALTEEGWTRGKEADAVLSRYLSELPAGCGTLVLGCTHFPLLAPALRHLLPKGITLIDSAAATAEAVKGFLGQTDRQKKGSRAGQTTFYVTDAPERFDRLSAGFLGQKIRTRAACIGIGC